MIYTDQEIRPQIESREAAQDGQNALSVYFLDLPEETKREYEPWSLPFVLKMPNCPDAPRDRYSAKQQEVYEHEALRDRPERCLYCRLTHSANLQTNLRITIDSTAATPATV